MLDLTVIILTKNEEIHIGRCIENVKPIAKEIVIVDSESTDKTAEIATELGAKVYVNKWPGNQAAQFNWALDNVPISTEWILRLDADEYLSDELKKELTEKLPQLTHDISGIDLERKLIFLGRLMKHGTRNIFFMRIFRKGKGRCANRRMDEHIQILEGSTIKMDNIFFDDNKHNLQWWTAKHNDYAIREAAELLEAEINQPTDTQLTNTDSQYSTAKRKKELFTRLPMFSRAMTYFLYRYFVKKSFLDGKEGFIWCFLQGWWYRTLVDANIFQIKKICGNDPQKIREYFLTHHNIKLN